MRRKIKTIVNAFCEIVTILAVIALISFAIVWIVWFVERCLPAHIWEAFVDAVNRSFGGQP